MNIMHSSFPSKAFTSSYWSSSSSTTSQSACLLRTPSMMLKFGTVDDSMGLMQRGQYISKGSTNGTAALGRLSLSGATYQFCTVMKASADGRKIVANANASYAAPLESSFGSSFIIRPLAEILRDLNKKVPDQVLQGKPGSHQKHIPWYQANRMLSFYAPGWCGEVRDITFSADGKFVTVIYRVTIRGSDGEAFREASGTVYTADSEGEDPTQQAEQMAFVRACARFGLGLYLHHE